MYISIFKISLRWEQSKTETYSLFVCTNLANKDLNYRRRGQEEQINEVQYRNLLQGLNIIEIKQTGKNTMKPFTAQSIAQFATNTFMSFPPFSSGFLLERRDFFSHLCWEQKPSGGPSKFVSCSDTNARLFTLKLDSDWIQGNSSGVY